MRFCHFCTLSQNKTTIPYFKNSNKFSKSYILKGGRADNFFPVECLVGREYITVQGGFRGDETLLETMMTKVHEKFQDDYIKIS